MEQGWDESERGTQHTAAALGAQAWSQFPSASDFSPSATDAVGYVQHKSHSDMFLDLRIPGKDKLKLQGWIPAWAAVLSHLWA